MPARRGSAQAQSRALAFTATVGGECRHGTLPGGCSRERTTTNRIACGATGAHTGLVSSTPAVRAALAWVRDDFMCLSNATGPLLNQPTHGTKWTNRELLFHLWFGQRVARVLMRIIGVLSRLPPGSSLAWARLLTAATRPYEWINYAASAAGGRVVPLRVTRSLMRRDTRALLRWADRASAADLARGMSVPASWDPYFSPWMSRAHVLAWAPKHYRHHRAQLTLGGL